MDRLLGLPCLDHVLEFLLFRSVHLLATAESTSLLWPQSGDDAQGDVRRRFPVISGTVAPRVLPIRINSIMGPPSSTFSNSFHALENVQFYLEHQSGLGPAMDSGITIDSAPLVSMRALFSGVPYLHVIGKQFQPQFLVPLLSVCRRLLSRCIFLGLPFPPVNQTSLRQHVATDDILELMYGPSVDVIGLTQEMAFYVRCEHGRVIKDFLL